MDIIFQAIPGKAGKEQVAELTERCRNYGRDLWVKLNRDWSVSEVVSHTSHWLYRFWISPIIGPHCRFEPTCSQYAVTPVEKYGRFWVFWLTLKRLGKCHPLHRGGVDPAPTVSSIRPNQR
ncbi:MAG: hypothetical protein CM1200mP9_00220 [Gammaproteobacteria bacterium]|nr:MAG: hypothetical protein CM1200mP9_00220 [Gammaproteobacteria bacterium]